MINMYTNLDLTLNIDEQPWLDIGDAGFAHGVLRRIAGIPLGSAHGNATVGLAVQLDDGTWVVAQTTLRLLHSAVDALAERYKDDLATEPEGDRPS